MCGRSWFNASSFWALAAVASAALAPPSYAGGCPPAAVSYSYSYAAPAAVSYAPVSYAAPVKTVYQTQKIYVPYAVKAPVSPDYYSSSADYYRDKLLVDAVAGKTAEALRMQEELSQLRQQVQQFQYQQQQWQSWPGAGPGQQHAPPPQHQPPPPRMPPAYNGYHGPQQQPQSRSAPGDVPEGLQQVLANSCLRCHGPTAPQQGGGLDLRDPGSVPWETRLLCHSEVCNGSMPRGGRQLSPEETALFYEWAQAGRVARR